MRFYALDTNESEAVFGALKVQKQPSRGVPSK